MQLKYLYPTSERNNTTSDLNPLTLTSATLTATPVNLTSATSILATGLTSSPIFSTSHNIGGYLAISYIVWWHWYRDNQNVYGWRCLKGILPCWHCSFFILFCNCSVSMTPGVVSMVLGGWSCPSGSNHGPFTLLDKLCLIVVLVALICISLHSAYMWFSV